MSVEAVSEALGVEPGPMDKVSITVASTSTLVITNGTEDFLTKKSAWFRLESSVINSLGILYFTFRPRTDGFR